MIIKQILKAYFLASLFALLSCLGGQRTKGPDPDIVTGGGVVLTPELIANNCIRHEFQQGQDDKLFGRDCIEGKQLRIKSASSGEAVSLMSTDGEEESVVIEEGIDFINKVYDLEYNILEGKGDDKEIPFLLDFISEGEEFQGIPNQRYSLIFKTVGNYLVLYKATKNKNNIPYNERSSMLVEETKRGDSLYMVPFIGYPIQYCKAEPIRNAQQEITRMTRRNCDSEPSEERKYLLINTGGKQVFEYLDKQDTFPVDYFEGDWFFAKTQINSNISAQINSNISEGEIANVDAKLVRLKQELESLVVIDKSGNIERDLDKDIYKIPVQWKEFELNKENEIFSTFGEKLNTNKNYLTRSHLKVLFQDVKGAQAIEEIVISPEYFSFVYLNRVGNVVSKVKVSLLKTSYVKSDQFKPRRWFLEEWDKFFALIPVQPQSELRNIINDQEESYSHFRVLKFDTGLYTEEEKAAGTKTIKWYFSKNSTKENYYREVAQEAMAVYNRAFQIIADGEAPKIQFELVKDEEKSLGDMRYNIMNLIKITDLSTDRSNLLGLAPTYQNPDTGQAIANVSNISIHSVEKNFTVLVRDYTRYEIFQRPKLSEEENKIHVVSDYIRWKIQKECKELEKFIDQKRGTLTDYRTKLRDFNLIEACAVKVSKPYLLTLILHEMGHSCSKHHNFSCSLDEKNFYKDLDELKKYFPSADLSDLEALQSAGMNPIPKASCVMDYGYNEELGLPVLGKNDLMVLRYVYEDELELEGHELENPKVHQMEVDYNTVKKQTSLSSNPTLVNKKKEYRNCPPTQEGRSQQDCYARDYGASYKEAAEYLSLKMKRKTQLRYAYDLDLDNVLPKNLRFSLALFDLLRMSNYHINWLQLRNNFLKSGANRQLMKYHLDDEQSTTSYEKAINPNHSDNEGRFTQEYKDYYPVADIFTEAVKFALFQRPFQCLVQSKDEDGKTEEIGLSYLIYNQLNTKYEKDLYVIDCYSEQVVNFLNENNLELIGQYGIQNFNPETVIEYTSKNGKMLLIPFSTYAFSNDEYKRPDILSLGYFATSLLEKSSIEKIFLPAMYNLGFLKEMDEKSKENLLDINQYLSEIEMIRNRVLLVNIYNHVTHAAFNTSASARTTYKKDIGYLISSARTGPNSFYQTIEEPLILGYPIGSFQSSFLTKLYSEYKEALKQNSNFPTFQSYVVNKQEVALVDYDEQGTVIFIPVEEGSFSYKMAKKYNEVLNEIKELEAKSDLSLLEKSHKVKLENFRDNFYANLSGFAYQP